MTYHVAFIKKIYINKIISGEKTFEIRLSYNRPPAWSVEHGDTLLLKVSGGDIVAKCTVKDVHKFDNLRPCDVTALADMFATPSSPYFAMKSKSRYCVAMELSDVQLGNFPPDMTPRNVMSAWVSNFYLGYLFKSR